MRVIAWRVALLAAAIGMSGCSGGGNAAQSPTPSAHQELPPADSQVASALINVSASTNFKAFNIAVSQSGTATLTVAGASHTITLPAATSTAFFADVAQAQPLSALPAQTDCAKSASFGTTTTVSDTTGTSPDISCPSAGVEQNLYNDVNAIISAAQAP